MLCSTGCKDCGSDSINIYGFFCFSLFLQWFHVVFAYESWFDWFSLVSEMVLHTLSKRCCVKPGVRIMDLYQDLLAPYLYTILILHILYIIYSVSIMNIGFACALQEVLCYTGCECHGICLCPHVHNQLLLAEPLRKPRKTKNIKNHIQILGEIIEETKKTNHRYY